MDVRFVVYLRGEDDLGYRFEDWFNGFDAAYSYVKYMTTELYTKGWMIDRESWRLENEKSVYDVVCIAQSKEA